MKPWDGINNSSSMFSDNWTHFWIYFTSRVYSSSSRRVCGRKYGDNDVWVYVAELSPVLFGVGVCKLPITVTTGPTGKVEGRWSDLHTWDESKQEIRVQLLAKL